MTGPYDYARELHDAHEADPYSARLIAGEWVPEEDIPDEGDLL